MRRLARSPKRNKRKVVSGSRVTLPENFACKPELSFNPLARVTLAVGLPYLLVNRALVSTGYFTPHVYLVNYKPYIGNFHTHYVNKSGTLTRKTVLLISLLN